MQRVHIMQSALYGKRPFHVVFQSVLLCSALYANYPYYVLLYMQSVFIV